MKTFSAVNQSLKMTAAGKVIRESESFDAKKRGAVACGSGMRWRSNIYLLPCVEEACWKIGCTAKESMAGIGAGLGGLGGRAIKRESLNSSFASANNSESTIFSASAKSI